MSKKIEDYKIGDELFRYVDMAGVFRYLVIGRRETSREIQLEVESQTCSHGWKCQLLLASDDYGRIFHVHMLNEDEDRPQKYWHSNDGFFFCETSEQAKAQKMEKLIASQTEAVNKAEDVLKAAKKRLADLKGINEGVQS